MTETQFLAPGVKLDEDELERSLRPRRLDEFVGQERVKEQLAIALEATRTRGEALDHVLLIGPPGLGKTSLAHIVREELGVGLRSAAGPALERKGDVAAILTALERARHPLHRRDPPAQPRRRGDPLPGARGLPPRHHRRPGAGGAHADARPAAVHARRGDHADGAPDQPAPRPLRHDLPARATTSRPSSARIVRRSAQILERRDRGRGRRRDRRPLPRDAAHREPDPAARPRRRRGAARGLDHDRDRARGARAARGRRARARAHRPRAPARRSSRSSTAGRSGSRRSRSRSARSRTRSRTSTSRTCSSSASCSARRAAAS